MLGFDEKKNVLELLKKTFAVWPGSCAEVSDRAWAPTRPAWTVLAVYHRRAGCARGVGWCVGEPLHGSITSLICAVSAARGRGVTWPVLRAPHSPAAWLGSYHSSYHVPDIVPCHVSTWSLSTHRRGRPGQPGLIGALDCPDRPLSIAHSGPGTLSEITTKADGP